MYTVLDGKKLAGEIKEEIRTQVDSTEKNFGLATVLIGNDPASKKYVELKGKDCAEVGIDFEIYRPSPDISQKEVIDLIEKLNTNERFDGIIVQLPVPAHLDQYEILENVDPKKDVDGLHPLNIGRLWSSNYDFEKDLLPCTPKGVMRLLDRYEIELKGKRTVIVNRSNLVGKPLAKLMLDRNATLTVCHSRTRNIEKHISSADILVTAVGNRPNFVVAENMVSKNAIVVDIGMNYLEDGLCGDVEFDEVKEKTSYITPVPGGVGPMTRIMLLENVLIAGGAKIEHSEGE